MLCDVPYIRVLRLGIKGLVRLQVLLYFYAAVVKLVDTADLKSAGEILVGSSPIGGTRRSERICLVSITCYGQKGETVVHKYLVRHFFTCYIFALLVQRSERATYNRLMLVRVQQGAPLLYFRKNYSCFNERRRNSIWTNISLHMLLERLQL